MDRRWLVLVCLLLACGYAVVYRPYPTLLVRNEGPVPVHVYVRGMKLGVADAMQTTCLSLRSMPTGATGVHLRPTGEKGFTTWPEELSIRAGWEVTVTQPHRRTFDAISLQPAGACK